MGWGGGISERLSSGRQLDNCDVLAGFKRKKCLDIQWQQVMRPLCEDTKVAKETIKIFPAQSIKLIGFRKHLSMKY